MDLRIMAVNGGGVNPSQELRLRSDDGRAHGVIHFTDPALFTQAVQGDTISLDIDVSGYEEPQTVGAGATVTTTDVGGQPMPEQPANVVVAQPAVPAQPTRRRGSQQ